MMMMTIVLILLLLLLLLLLLALSEQDLPAPGMPKDLNSTRLGRFTQGTWGEKRPLGFGLRVLPPRLSRSRSSPGASNMETSRCV